MPEAYCATHLMMSASVTGLASGKITDACNIVSAWLLEGADAVGAHHERHSLTKRSLPDPATNIAYS
jgi:hypothetical protein